MGRGGMLWICNSDGLTHWSDALRVPTTFNLPQLSAQSVWHSHTLPHLYTLFQHCSGTHTLPHSHTCSAGVPAIDPSSLALYFNSTWGSRGRVESEKGSWSRMWMEQPLKRIWKTSCTLCQNALVKEIRWILAGLQFVTTEWNDISSPELWSYSRKRGLCNLNETQSANG